MHRHLSGPAVTDHPRLRVLLAGGGSGGSAAPVIAVGEALTRLAPETEILFVGTRTGPEQALVEAAGFRFVGIPSGRLRRYLTWRNLVDPVLVLVGVVRAFGVVRSFRPDAAFGAGGFATVPPLFAARLLGARVMIHQQDAEPGLANRILSPFASLVSIAFPPLAAHFRAKRTTVVGNPVRSAILTADPARARARWNLDSTLPVVLAMGGGTGAVGLNRLIAEAAPDLSEIAQVVHLTGAGRAVGGWTHPRYRAIDFVSAEFPDLLAAADVVVTRSGMSSLTEVSALGKPAIVVPMPDSHQESNAEMMRRAGAALVFAEVELTPSKLVEVVRELLANEGRRQELGAAARAMLPTGAGGAIAAELLRLAGRASS